MINTGKKKHQHARVVNGKTYAGYRKSRTYKGKKVTITAPNSTEWEARYEARKAEIDAAHLSTNPKITVQGLSEIFLRDALNDKRPSTYSEREWIINKYILPHIGHLNLRNVKNEHVSNLYDIVRALSPSVLEHTHKVLNRMFQFAIENEICITVNPISVGLLKQVRGAVHSANNDKAIYAGLSLEDIDYILLEVRGHRHEIIFHFQILHGLRIGEALGVKWEDIDFENCWLNVNRQVSNVSKSKMQSTKWAIGNGPIITPPKTGRSRRSVPLQEATKILLEKTSVQERSNFIYCTANGNPHMVNNFRRDVFNPLRKKLGLETMQTHDLRKFFGSWLLTQDNLDIATVSKWMGHSPPAITLGVYAKVISEIENSHRYSIGRALVKAK